MASLLLLLDINLIEVIFSDDCAGGMRTSGDKKAWTKGDQLEEDVSGPGVRH